eukprot:m51a1_g3711 hypothetical protein (445) ;mRNA; f:439308-444755
MLSCLGDAPAASKRRAAAASLVALGAALAAVTSAVDEVSGAFFAEQAGLAHAQAAAAASLALAVNYGAAVAGGVLADTALAAYGSVVLASTFLSFGLAVLLAGSVVLPVLGASSASSGLSSSALAAPDSGPGGRALSLAAFFLTLAGTGGLRPCVVSLLGDQYPAALAPRRSELFVHLYTAFQLGALAISLSFPLLRAAGHERPWVVFALCLAVVEWPLAVFLSCRDTFVHRGCASGESAALLLNACAGPGGERGGARRDRRAARGLLALAVPSVCFWGVYYQNYSGWVAQAQRMRRSLGPGGWELPAREVVALNNALNVVLVPLAHFAVLPALRRRLGLALGPVARMTAGFALGALAAALAGAVQAVLAVRSVHVAWIVPQYVALSASEALLAVTAYDVAYSRAPAHTRATAVSVWLATVALGRGLTALVDLLPLPDEKGSIA